MRGQAHRWLCLYGPNSTCACGPSWPAVPVAGGTVWLKTGSGALGQDAQPGDSSGARRCPRGAPPPRRAPVITGRSGWRARRPARGAVGTLSQCTGSSGQGRAGSEPLTTSRLRARPQALRHHRPHGHKALGSGNPPSGAAALSCRRPGQVPPQGCGSRGHTARPLLRRRKCHRRTRSVRVPQVRTPGWGPGRCMASAPCFQPPELRAPPCRRPGRHGSLGR